MNTKGNWLTTATILDEERREIWGFVFQNATVPIKSIFPQTVTVPGHENALAYMLDLDALTDLEREDVITVISAIFKIDSEEVRRDLHLGVPILAEGTSVMTRDQGIAFSMLGEIDDSRFWDLDEDLRGDQLWEED